LVVQTTQKPDRLVTRELADELIRPHNDCFPDQLKGLGINLGSIEDQLNRTWQGMVHQISPLVEKALSGEEELLEISPLEYKTQRGDLIKEDSSQAVKIKINDYATVIVEYPYETKFTENKPDHQPKRITILKETKDTSGLERKIKQEIGLDRQQKLSWRVTIETQAPPTEGEDKIYFLCVEHIDHSAHGLAVGIHVEDDRYRLDGSGERNSIIVSAGDLNTQANRTRYLHDLKMGGEETRFSWVYGPDPTEITEQNYDLKALLLRISTDLINSQRMFSLTTDRPS
jgi:hypothetical protein